MCVILPMSSSLVRLRTFLLQKKENDSMKLMFVKQGKFLGTTCDFYVDEEKKIYMSRTQVGYALQYKNASKSIEKIHDRHKKRIDKFSVMVRGSQIGGGSKNIDPNQDIWMYTERGIYELCRFSYQKVADDFYDWVYDTIISIRKNGYYIATEKDEKWLGIRQETKKVRNEETDMIKKFISYAEKQGSSHASNYYTLLTNVANNRCGIKSGERDKADQKTLLRLKSLETLIEMRLETLMNKNLPYKEVFRGVKELIENI